VSAHLIIFALPGLVPPVESYIAVILSSRYIHDIDMLVFIKRAYSHYLNHWSREGKLEF
jgi:hypothetical protein